MQKSFEAIAQRAANAESAFIDALQANNGITREDASRVLTYYLKHRIAKIDHGIGHVNVKHGAFLDQDVILRAVEQTRPR